MVSTPTSALGRPCSLNGSSMSGERSDILLSIDSRGARGLVDEGEPNDITAKGCRRSRQGQW